MRKSLVFILVLLPIVASADPVKIGDIYYNIITKANAAEVTINPDLYSGNINIPSTVKYNDIDYTVKYIGDNAFMNCSGLNSVTIPESVTTIGNSAFLMCTGLTAMTIPTKVTTIGNYAFQDCIGITSIVIPTSVTTIGEGAFAHSGLTSISIPNSISSISPSAFFECQSLVSVSIPNTVSDIFNNAFDGCTNLTSVTIPEGVSFISTSAFHGCSSLASINLPSSVTSFGMSAFQNCSLLESVTIPSGVNFIPDNLFSGCSKLSSVNLPEGMTTISQGAFSGCISLTSITIPANVKYIGNLAFSNCDNLIDVYCEPEQLATDPSSLDAFYTSPDAFKDSYQESITLHVPSSSIAAYKAIEPWKYFKDVVALGGGTSTTKCAKPGISYDSATGTIDFTCSTTGVEFVSSVTCEDVKSYSTASITLTQKFTISVYATKAGMDNSDTATMDIIITGSGKAIVVGDMDGNGTLDAVDIVTLVDSIMGR